MFDGDDVTTRSTSYRIARGMAIVPENRRLFGPMTVLENLEMGAYLRGGGEREDFDRVYSTLPAPRTSGGASSRGRSPAASSRWWRWDVR